MESVKKRKTRAAARTRRGGQSQTDNCIHLFFISARGRHGRRHSATGHRAYRRIQRTRAAEEGAVITPETEINTALNLSFSDSNTLMRRYFDTFGVDSSNYNHELYFQPPSNTGRWFSPPPVKNTPGRCAYRCWCARRAPNAGCTTSIFLSSNCASARLLLQQLGELRQPLRMRRQAGAVTRLPSTCA